MERHKWLTSRALIYIVKTTDTIERSLALSKLLQKHAVGVDGENVTFDGSVTATELVSLQHAWAAVEAWPKELEISDLQNDAVGLLHV